VYPSRAGGDVTPETVKNEIESFLKDPDALRKFYEEAGGRSPAVAGLGSPVIGPVGVGSPTMGTSAVHGVGRTTSMKSGRSSIADLAPEDFMLGRSGI
jgi:hypothetical protein